MREDYIDLYSREVQALYSGAGRSLCGFNVNAKCYVMLARIEGGVRDWTPQARRGVPPMRPCHSRLPIGYTYYQCF